MVISMGRGPPHPFRLARGGRVWYGPMWNPTSIAINGSAIVVILLAVTTDSGIIRDTIDDVDVAVFPVRSTRTRTPDAVASGMSKTFCQ